MSTYNSSQYSLPRPIYDVPQTVIPRPPLVIYSPSTDDDTPSTSRAPNGILKHTNHTNLVRRTDSDEGSYAQLHNPPVYNPKHLAESDNQRGFEVVPLNDYDYLDGGTERESDLRFVVPSDVHQASKKEPWWKTFPDQNRAAHWAICVTLGVIAFAGVVVGIYFMAHYFLTAGISKTRTVRTVLFAVTLTAEIALPTNQTVDSYITKTWNTEFQTENSYAFDDIFHSRPTYSDFAYKTLPLEDEILLALFDSRFEIPVGELAGATPKFEISFRVSFQTSEPDATLRSQVIEAVTRAANQTPGTTVERVEAEEVTGKPTTTARSETSTISTSTTSTSRGETTYTATEPATTDMSTAETETTSEPTTEMSTEEPPTTEPVETTFEMSTDGKQTETPIIITTPATPPATPVTSEPLIDTTDDELQDSESEIEEEAETETESDEELSETLNSTDHPARQKRGEFVAKDAEEDNLSNGEEDILQVQVQEAEQNAALAELPESEIAELPESEIAKLPASKTVFASHTQSKAEYAASASHQKSTTAQSSSVVAGNGAIAQVSASTVSHEAASAQAAASHVTESQVESVQWEGPQGEQEVEVDSETALNAVAKKSISNSSKMVSSSSSYSSSSYSSSYSASSKSSSTVLSSGAMATQAEGAPEAETTAVSNQAKSTNAESNETVEQQVHSQHSEDRSSQVHTMLDNLENDMKNARITSVSTAKQSSMQKQSSQKKTSAVKMIEMNFESENVDDWTD